MISVNKVRHARLALLLLCFPAVIIGGAIAGALLLVIGTHYFGFLVGIGGRIGFTALIATAFSYLEAATDRAS